MENYDKSLEEVLKDSAKNYHKKQLKMSWKNKEVKFEKFK